MRNPTVVLALTLALVTGATTGARAAESGFSDVICPEATQYVLAVGKLRKDDPPQRIYDAAQAVTDAYQRCSKDKLSNGFREAQHYADTRGSSFAVVAARALVALNRPEDARRELLLWRPLVQQVVDWKAETQTTAVGHKPPADDSGDTASAPRLDAGGPRAGDNRPSAYRTSAKEIVVAIDAELGKIADLHLPAPKP
jgi:hypothetical protein